MKKKQTHIDTTIIHAGEPLPRLGGAVVAPIFQSSTFVYPEEEQSYNDIKYIRLNNTPTHTVLHAKLAALEGTEAGLVTASGMAAISTTLLTLLKSGDHALFQDCLYGGTFALINHDLPALGITHDRIDATDPASWKRRLRPTTRVIYVEALTNPLLQVADHRAVVAFAKEHGLVAVIDSTFASPVNFRPAALGYDVVLHSATKYLNGHSDIVAGAVLGAAPLVERITHKVNHFGGSLDPHAAFLLHRGLKTLGVRVRHQNATALHLAQVLTLRDDIAAVHYPGLETHPHHDRARDLFAGSGGVLSFEPKGGAERAKAVIAKLRLAMHAPSLGGVETLVTRPATTTHALMSADERRSAGISDALIRLSVGLEDMVDLADDLAQALGD